LSFSIAIAIAIAKRKKERKKERERKRKHRKHGNEHEKIIIFIRCGWNTYLAQIEDFPGNGGIVGKNKCEKKI
jgi:hypothetical protein